MAATLRASPLDAFFSVAVPLAKPGFITATILGFAHTVGEFGVVLMIGGNIPDKTRVVSVLIYDAKHKLKKTVVVGFRPTGSAEKHEVRLTLPAGRYTWRVTCIDYAGRMQAKAGSSTLVVKPATR